MKKFVASLLVTTAVCAGAAQAWESSNDNGRIRVFDNPEYDLNLRAWPAPWSQSFGAIPQGTQMRATRCIHPANVEHDWCYVTLPNGATGWASAYYMREIGSYYPGHPFVAHVPAPVYVTPAPVQLPEVVVTPPPAAPSHDTVQQVQAPSSASGNTTNFTITIAPGQPPVIVDSSKQVVQGPQKN